MKLLTILALCIASSAVAAPKSPFLAPEVNGVERISGAERLEVKKNYDGKVAVCDSSAHVGYQAYRLQVVRAGGSTAHLRLTSLVCAEENGKYLLKPSLYLKQLPNGIQVSDSQILVTDERYNIVANVPVSATSVTTDFSIDIGNATQVRWEAFVRSTLSANGEKFLATGGIFNVIL